MPQATLRDRILEMMRDRDYRPLNKSELSRHLEVAPDDRSELRRELQKLEQDGSIVAGNKGRYELRGGGGGSRGGAPQLRGGIKFNPKGLAWFFPDVLDEQNQATGFDLETHSRIHVARHATGTALDGDQVLCSISFPNPHPKLYRNAKRDGFDPEKVEPRAKVERILKRRSNQLVGSYRCKGRHHWVEPDDFAVDERIEIEGETTARPGQMVVVQLGDWQAGTPRGKIIEVLGWPGDTGVDILAIIHRNGIKTSFPDEVLAAARAIPDEVTPAEAELREDWRDRLVITIDPADAKDHDDAIWVGKTDKGWQLAVHIADVSHYVKPGTPLDTEAVERGNSTYLVDRVIPMLPVELSNGICSLKPHVDRLTKCAVLDINPQGKVVSSRFCAGLIHSQSKLSYEQAQSILDGGSAPDGSPEGLEEMVREAWKMASKLRARRFKIGALDLEMPEVRVRLGDDGKPVALDNVEHTASHQLVEECMLAANESVARVLKQRNKPAVYRVHEDPDLGRLQEFAETAIAYGYRPGDLSNKDHVQKLLDEAKGNPDEHVIKIGLLKSLKRATYSNEPLGHYGLSKADYCHFTSPIRRYADLIVHRALQPHLSNAPKKPDKTPSHAALAEVARHISTTERASSDAEGESRLIKLLEYLDACSKQNPPVVFNGLITEVRTAGLMVEATDISTRGMVRRADLPGGLWRLDRGQSALVGPGGKRLQMGQRVELVVSNINFERRFVDFQIAGDPPDAKGSSGSSRGRSGGSRKSSGGGGPKSPRNSDSKRDSGRGGSSRKPAGKSDKSDKSGKSGKSDQEPPKDDAKPKRSGRRRGGRKRRSR